MRSNSFALKMLLFGNVNSVKPVSSDHSRETEKVVVVGRWSLFTGQVTGNVLLRETQTWSLYTGGRSPQVVAISY